MILLAYIVGLAIPTLAGWVLLRLLEGKATVLLPAERCVLGLMLGLAYGMFLAFLLYEWAGIRLTLWGYLSAYALLLVPLGVLSLVRGMTQGEGVELASSRPFSRTATILMWIAGLWIITKVLLTSVTFLLLTPTFLDDSLDNWNLRGTVFYHDQALTLVMPGEDAVSSPRGVSSYPPTVPMVKAWLANLAGGWSDPVANGVQGVWYLATLALVYTFGRRSFSRGWAMVAVYVLSGMPLFLMHGTNPYGDAFLAAHVLAAAGTTWLMLRAEASDERAAWVRISAVCVAILAFTKNEGLLVYLPPLLLIAMGGVLLEWKRGLWEKREMLHALTWYALATLCVAGPWLAFKWSHGLTFGNARPFTSLGFTWQPNVLAAIFINTFFEGNWLLLFPLFFALLAWRRRSAFGRYSVLTLFFLTVYLGQAFLYMFTSLSVEALRQTGYARGLVHLIPTVALLTTLLLAEAMQAHFRTPKSETA